MVRLLALAHERCCEAELAAELDAILGSGELPDPELLEARFAPASMISPKVTVTLPSAGAYDALLSNTAAEVSA
jgi:hypothetical protein